MSADEVRPYLNAIFMSCRALSKIIVPLAHDGTAGAMAEDVKYLAETLRRYDWLRKHSSALCEAKGLNTTETFGQELSICTEMCLLLPAKIDKMHYARRG